MKVHEKNKIFKKKYLVFFQKTEKGWIEKDYKEFDGDRIGASLAINFEGEGGLIWGSPEHLAELAEHGLTLPKS